MNKFASKLIEYGVDFQYECMNSNGQKLTSFEASVDITLKNGKIYIKHRGEDHKLDDNESSRKYAVSLLEDILIDETTQ